MKRQSLLIAGCLLGAVSVGLNIHLYFQRREASAPRAPAQEVPLTPPEAAQADDVPVRAISALPEVKFDFSDTAFADGSWKLTEPAALDLDKPFDWEDVNPARPKVDPNNPFDVDPPKAPLFIKERYAGEPAKIDGNAGKAAPPPPSPPK